MSVHTFDPSIAQKVGLNAAVIFQNIRYWIEKNEAAGSERHFHEGRWWTYMSVKGFERLFWYLTAKQIRGALDKLEEDGLIGTGNFNQSAYDRTRWFCLGGDFDLPNGANGKDAKGEPIPDVNPDHKPDVDPIDRAASQPSLFSADPTEGKEETVGKSNLTATQVNEAFDEFWKVYPRKIEKKAARDAFAAAVRGKKGVEPIPPSRIVEAARAFAETADTAPDKIRFIRYPARWITHRRWEDQEAPSRIGEAEDARRAAVILMQTWYEERAREHPAMPAPRCDQAADMLRALRAEHGWTDSQWAEMQAEAKRLARWDQAAWDARVAEHEAHKAAIARRRAENAPPSASAGAGRGESGVNGYHHAGGA